MPQPGLHDRTRQTIRVGLCYRCYNAARRLVEDGQTTWDALEAAGKIRRVNNSINGAAANQEIIAWILQAPTNQPTEQHQPITTMWIFSKHGFFSVTQSAQRRDLIQIRARAEKDLASLKATYPHLDRSPIIETPEADYQFRIVVQRWKWELIAGKLMADIDYSNFKGKMATLEQQRDKLGMLHDIWHLHHEYQERPRRADRYAGHPELFRPHGDYLIDPEQFDQRDDEQDPYLDQARAAAENTLERDASRAPKRRKGKGQQG